MPPRLSRARSDAFGQGPRLRRGFQIGPRIRIGGTLGKIGQDIKIGAGKVLSNPITEGLVGATLGPGAAAGLGALGTALDTSGGGLHGTSGLGQLAAAGLSGYGAGSLGAGIRGAIGQGVGGLGRIAPAILSKLGVGGGAPGAPGAIGPDGQPAGAPGGAPGQGGFDWGRAARLAAGAAAAAQAAQLQGKSMGLVDRGVQTAEDSYKARDPFRQQGGMIMQNPSAGVNLSGLSTIQGANPFSAARLSRA